MNILAKIIAKNPPSILFVFGGFGWIANNLGLIVSTSYWWFIVLGVLLQVLWMFKG